MNSKDTQDSELAALWSQDPAARINCPCKWNTYLTEIIPNIRLCTSKYLKKTIFSLPPLVLMLKDLNIAVSNRNYLVFQ